jgi:hypothetical protein
MNPSKLILNKPHSVIRTITFEGSRFMSRRAVGTMPTMGQAHDYASVLRGRALAAGEALAGVTVNFTVEVA